jgi:hypothetical protein
LRQKRTEGLLIKDLMEHYSLSQASIYRPLGDSSEALKHVEYQQNLKTDCDVLA